MTAKDAFNNTCLYIEKAYRNYGFKYYKTKKLMKANINGCEVAVFFDTSRDNTSDYFVCFDFRTSVVLSDGQKVALKMPIFQDINGRRQVQVKLQGDDVFEIVDGIDINSHQLCKQKRLCREMYCLYWNVAFPQHQLRCAKDVCFILDTVFFSSPQVVDALGCQVKAEIDYE